jgi:hypothetical protein
LLAANVTPIDHVRMKRIKKSNESKHIKKSNRVESLIQQRAFRQRTHQPKKAALLGRLLFAAIRRMSR